MGETQPLTIYCPQCGKANDRDRQQCIQCGIPLVTTLKISEDDVPPAPQALQALVSNISGQLGQTGTLVISVAGYDHPIYVRRQPEISLGRSAPGEPAPTVDLGMFRGQQMGVSRRHAIIRFEEHAVTIEDLGSANGSWLNENRLTPNHPHPLHAGDYLRLGHLILVVQASDVDTLVLQETNPERLVSDKVPRLTPYDLIHHLGPYLNTLTKLQHLIMELADQKPGLTSIHRVTVQDDGWVQARLSGTTRALDFVAQHIQPWRTRHRDLLLHAQHVAQATGLTLTLENADEALRIQLTKTFEMLQQDATQALTSEHSADGVESFNSRLREVLEVLALSTLSPIQKPVTGELPNAGIGSPSDTQPPPPGNATLTSAL